MSIEMERSLSQRRWDALMTWASLLTVLGTAPAWAGGPTQGTFAGDRTRGSIVTGNVQQYNTTPGGYGAQVKAQATDPLDNGRGNVSNQIASDSVVGTGKTKPTY